MIHDRCREHKLKIVRDERCVLCLAQHRWRMRAGLIVLTAGVGSALYPLAARVLPREAVATQEHAPAFSTHDRASTESIGAQRVTMRDATNDRETHAAQECVAPLNGEDRDLGGAEAGRAPIVGGTPPPEPPRARVDPVPWLADDPRDWDLPQR